MATNIEGNYTIEAWVMMQEPEQPDISILKVGEASGFGMELKTESGQYKLCTHLGQNESIFTEIPNSQESWRHLAVTIDDLVSEIYIDGQLIETGPGQLLDINPNININSRFIDKITEVRVWNTARTKEDINGSMFHSLTGSEQELIAYMPLKGIPCVSKFSGKCLNIDIKSYACVPELLLSDSSVPRLTVEFWVKVKEEGMLGAIFDYDGEFCIKNPHDLTFSVCREEGKIYPEFNIIDGDWHHIAITWHALTGKLILYKDGEEICKTILARGNSLPGSGSFYLGKEPFAGQLSEVRIWNAVRSQEEIVQDMFFQLTGNEPDLLSYWQLNSQVLNSAVLPEDAGMDAAARDLSLMAQDQTGNPVPVDDNFALKFGMWINSGLFLKQAPIIQAKRMRDQWDMLLKNLQAETGSGINGENTPIAIDTLIDNLNKEITKARKESENNLYFLRDVSMNLKAIPVTTGFGPPTVLLPTKEQLDEMHPDQMSTINLNFVPEITPEESSLQDVPSVIDYTEAAAKLRVEEAGFNPKVSYQTVTDLNKVGCVVNQYPAPGDQAPGLSNITIFVGKKLN